MDRKVRITHLELFKDNSHHYFGSMAAMYAEFSRDDLGISYPSLRAFNLNEKKEFRNDKCVIRQGYLVTSKQQNKISNSK